MPYTQRQCRIIAQALVRNDGRPSAALRWLDDYSIECPKVSRSGLLRLRKDPEFAALLNEETEALHQEELTGHPETWALPAVPMPESPENGQALMQKLAWACARRLAQRVSRPGAETRELVAFFEKAQKFAIALRKESAPKCSSLSGVASLLRTLFVAEGLAHSEVLASKLLNLAHPEFGNAYLDYSCRNDEEEERKLTAKKQCDLALKQIREAGKILYPRPHERAQGTPAPHLAPAVMDQKILEARQRVAEAQAAPPAPPAHAPVTASATAPPAPPAPAPQVADTCGVPRPTASGGTVPASL